MTPSQSPSHSSRIWSRTVCMRAAVSRSMDILSPLYRSSTLRRHPAFAPGPKGWEPTACLPVPYGLVDFRRSGIWSQDCLPPMILVLSRPIPRQARLPTMRVLLPNKCAFFYAISHDRLLFLHGALDGK